MKRCIVISIIAIMCLVVFVFAVFMYHTAEGHTVVMANTTFKSINFKIDPMFKQREQLDLEKNKPIFITK